MTNAQREPPMNVVRSRGFSVNVSLVCDVSHPPDMDMEMEFSRGTFTSGFPLIFFREDSCNL